MIEAVEEREDAGMSEVVGRPRSGWLSATTALPRLLLGSLGK